MAQTTEKIEPRLAELADLPRLALIACAAFYHISYFHYVRPEPETPDRAKATFDYHYSSLSTFATAQNGIPIVIENASEECEDSKLHKGLDIVERKMVEGGRFEKPKPGQKVTVGFACLTLQDGTSSVGNYQPKGFECINENGNVKKHGEDINQYGWEKAKSQLEGAVKKYTDGKLKVKSPGVHPAYWKRGHGTSLLIWATSLADQDQVSLVIESAHMGARRAKDVGFEELDVVQVPGYSRYDESIFVWFGIRKPRPLPASS